MAMIRRNQLDQGDLSVLRHEVCHAVISELEGIPYEYVQFGKGVLGDGTKVSGGFVPVQNLPDLVDQAVANGTAIEFMTKIAAVAEAGRWIDENLSQLPKQTCDLRAGGDDAMFEMLYERSKLPADQKERIQADGQQRIEDHAKVDTFIIVVEVLAQTLMQKKQLKPEDVKSVLTEHGFIDD